MYISITSLLTIFKKPESVIRHMSKKNAGVAAILNFILPGLGYIYARVRGTIFPWGLFLLSIWVAVHDWNEITAILSGQMAITEHFLLFIILYPIVFAYDGYKATKEANKKDRKS